MSQTCTKKHKNKVGEVGRVRVTVKKNYRGSPLQARGQFLVDVLKELGVQQTSELFVISVIGVQSSAKSTLLN